MAKITVKVKQTIHDSVNRATEKINSIDPAAIDWGDVFESIRDVFNGEMIRRIKAALRERGYMIADEEDIFDGAILTREVSRKSGIDFRDVLDKDMVMADLDNFISARFNDALGTKVSGISSMDVFKREMVNLIVAQVANGRMVEVLSRVTAGVIRKGIVYSKSFAGQPVAFDLAKHARKLDNRKYALKYRASNRQVWD
jgi:hypothetical protein